MTPPTDPPTTTPLPANVARLLDLAYQAHVGTPDASPPSAVTIVDGAVAATVSGNGEGDFASFLDSLRALGMQVQSSHEATWAVAGMLPLAQLPAAARLPQVRSIAPRIAPRTS
ncbi:hypothetical protein [Planctomyces sp. SH-PL62]|uniref:hypothetical protein n=1 Tax=Planctomyces sp. SH-PL62 TaxID=1636152 RepID=UPI00078C2751|nr:hypothetical protein [Planctomyces sp. SH-PL62]AMV40580.1 hypothetical protein VT85_24330 [Planctomyces sp. SH-PL62]